MHALRATHPALIEMKLALAQAVGGTGNADMCRAEFLSANPRIARIKHGLAGKLIVAQRYKWAGQLLQAALVIECRPGTDSWRPRSYLS